MIRRSESEKREIIHLVEHSALSAKKTLAELQVPRSTFYRWYRQYLEEGEAGLMDHRPNPHQVWNRIPQEVKQQVVDLALQHPDRSPRQIAWLFTDEKGYFISESSAYRILKSYDLVESPAFTVLSAADEFKHPTKRINELWQTDFTYFKILNWGWYYLSTVLDDFSRYILAWKLTPTMNASDVQDTLLLALAKTGLDHGLLSAFVSGCAITVGILGLNLLFGGTIDLQFIWNTFCSVVNGGAFLVLAIAWLASLFAEIVHPARSGSTSISQRQIA